MTAKKIKKSEEIHLPFFWNPGGWVFPEVSWLLASWLQSFSRLDLQDIRGSFHIKNHLLYVRFVLFALLCHKTIWGWLFWKMSTIIHWLTSKLERFVAKVKIILHVLKILHSLVQHLIKVCRNNGTCQTLDFFIYLNTHGCDNWNNTGRNLPERCF